MPLSRAKLVIGGTVIAGALSYLAVAATQSGWVYYRTVDQFVEEGSPAGRRVRLSGRVESLESRSSEPGAAFDLVGEAGRVRVQYRGHVPELMRPGCNVVAEGVLDQGGVFAADTLLTRCASKFRTERHGDGGGQP